MKLNEQLSKLKQTPEWDVIIIGGGASGLELHFCRQQRIQNHFS
jgi:glycerol-3-phosphate dehydrogenase